MSSCALAVRASASSGKVVDAGDAIAPQIARLGRDGHGPAVARVGRRFGAHGVELQPPAHRHRVVGVTPGLVPHGHGAQSVVGAPMRALDHAVQVGRLPAPGPGAADGVDQRLAQRSVDERRALGMGRTACQHGDELGGRSCPGIEHAGRHGPVDHLVDRSGMELVGTSSPATLTCAAGAGPRGGPSATRTRVTPGRPPPTLGLLLALALTHRLDPLSCWTLSGWTPTIPTTRTSVRIGCYKVGSVNACRSISDDERRARDGVRHRLAPAPGATPVCGGAGSLGALPSTDPASVFLSAAARMHDPTIEAIERALYEDRSLVRILGMRRTLFVVPRELVPVVHAACTRAIAAIQRRRYAGLIEEGGIAGDGAAWLERVGDATLAALERRGEAFGAVEVDLAGTTGYVLPDDAEPQAAPEPWVALLPALDSTAMGWTDRAFYGADDKVLYDRSGNIAPTVWSDGRVVGCWAQRADGEVAVRLLVDTGREAAAAIDEAAARLGKWLGPARVKSRFRTPIERELLA